MRDITTAVIFAGGKSSRMGKDKALLPFANYPTLAEFQQAKLSRLFDEVYISAKENKFDFDCRMIQDNYRENSPLVGIISVFETLKAEEVFILSVDAPFVSNETIEKILKQDDSGFDVVVAQSPSGVQPLCGLYKRSILPLAYRQLEKENHRLGDLLHLANTLFVAFDDDAPFTNLNRPEEYQQALKSFENR
ncbi:molybdenum cofactor guanylyltransferase MobA [Sulfurovum sp. XGS-02]|uniref:molybdenum cofactor guanylyltransferase MobA n=1 Tax=Sulfurovum sp. XGS-02 TaxID=2925411 RepID=UPI00204681C5|nr:molybdenum cofactor guanylyltransferase MobA [Sulfurovum sp. XGS-02]UPT77571.1 molybdenum cofactor guanylyltransferase MobA [Sulfurovum sp. XGS-02]